MKCLDHRQPISNIIHHNPNGNYQFSSFLSEFDLYSCHINFDTIANVLLKHQGSRQTEVHIYVSATRDNLLLRLEGLFWPGYCIYSYRQTEIAQKIVTFFSSIAFYFIELKEALSNSSEPRDSKSIPAPIFMLTSKDTFKLNIKLDLNNQVNDLFCWGII